MPSLSLEPEFRRSHGSLYKSLADGDVDDVRLRQALVEHRPKEWSLVFAVDASTWDRCDAECSPERGFTIQRPSTRPDSPSWRGGPISGSASWAGHMTRGRRLSTWNVSRRATTRPTPPQNRSAVSGEGADGLHYLELGLVILRELLFELHLLPFPAGHQTLQLGGGVDHNLHASLVTAGIRNGQEAPVQPFSTAPDKYLGSVLQRNPPISREVQTTP
jgi:hypothetical protein